VETAVWMTTVYVHVCSTSRVSSRTFKHPLCKL